MGKKILLNILYNIALMVMVLCLFWSIKHEQYAITLGSTVIVAFIIFLKIQLRKEVKAMFKEKKK